MSTTKFSGSNTTKDCLTLDDRPSTPPEIRKYRRNQEAGKKFIHYGISDDFSTMNLDNKIFGQSSERDKTTSADLIQHKTPSQLQQIETVKAERLYKSTKREMLGKSLERNVVLPSKFTQENQPFGISSQQSNVAVKDVIFPETIHQDDDDEIYIRTHNSFRPGEQTRRNYDWPINPDQIRFGVHGDTVAKNGASKSVFDVLHAPTPTTYTDDEIMPNGDVISKSQAKNMINNRPTDFVYGKPYIKQRRNAAELMKGRYSDVEQLPDRDLGKSLTPGFRNHTNDTKIYGAPSSKFSNNSIMLKSSIDPTATAKTLIHPSSYRNSSTTTNAFDELYSRKQLMILFNKIGTPLTEDIVNTVFNKAGREYRERDSVMKLSVFQTILNQYLDSMDM